MKLTINSEPDNFVLAIRAAKWLLANPKHKDAIIAYENGCDIYVKRTKAGMAATEVRRADDE